MDANASASSRRRMALLMTQNRRKRSQSNRSSLEALKKMNWRLIIISKTYALLVTAVLLSTITFPIDRSFWAKKRSGHWFDYALSEFSDVEWHENFRMKRSTFDFIVKQLTQEIEKKTTRWRKPVSTVKRVAITIWRLATNAEYRTLGHLFGVGRNTACKCVNITCKAICKILTPKFVSIPRGRRLDAVIDGFENKGFPQCVGAIDGTHIPIIAPHKDPADYYNRKGWHSINVQAVCDHEYRFTNIFVGFPGRAHDAKVLANSKLYEHAVNGQLFPDKPRMVAGVEVPLFLVGDPAYPLMPWLVKAYPGRQLDEEHTKFNDWLANVRKVIEMAFGRCKGRWRCLLKRNDSHISNMVYIIISCFTLHNICEIFKEGFDEEWLLDQDLDERVHRLLQPPTQSQESNDADRDAAKHIRDAIRDFVNS